MDSANDTPHEGDHHHGDLFDMVGDSIFIVDPTGLRIIDANSNAARRLGYERDELLQMVYSDIEVRHIDDPNRPTVWESSYSRTRFYEGVHRRKDGSETPVEVSSRIVKHHGQAVLLNLARDISLRKQLEAEREGLIAELDAYAHTVAHDLKSPVSAMIGYVDLLLSDIEGFSAEELREHLGTVRDGARKMLAIIDELLLLASIRKLEDVRLTPLDMAAITQTALGQVARLVKESGAAITLPDRWPVAIGYAPWVEQAWVNYLSNALRYGGEPPIIRLGGKEDGQRAIFWVQDNGEGIAPEDQGRLFGMFPHLNRARAGSHGLGLSIVRSIIAKLGGDVWLTSDAGEGSTFYFSLPRPERPE